MSQTTSEITHIFPSLSLPKREVWNRICEKKEKGHLRPNLITLGYASVPPSTWASSEHKTFHDPAKKRDFTPASFTKGFINMPHS